jgi:uncharacterized protein YyaL (SSP411 family)
MLAPAAVRHPESFGHLLLALDFHLQRTWEVALVTPAGEATGLDEFAAFMREAFRPHTVIAGGAEGSDLPELLAQRTAVDGKTAAYVCEGFACKAPVTGLAELEAALS